MVLFLDVSLSGDTRQSELTRIKSRMGAFTRNQCIDAVTSTIENIESRLNGTLEYPMISSLEQQLKILSPEPMIMFTRVKPLICIGRQNGSSKVDLAVVSLNKLITTINQLLYKDIYLRSKMGIFNAVSTPRI